MRITHTSGATDARYSVAKEWAGHPRQVYVARFEGEFIGWAHTEAGAWLKAGEHKLGRMGAAA